MDISEDSAYSKRQKPLLIAIKITITVILFYWILSQIEVEPLVANIRNTNINYLLVAIFLHALAFVLFSVRWWFLYHIQDAELRYKKTIGSYYLGLFFNNFLPTGVGGDVVRIIRLRNAGFNTHILVSSSLLDRILGLVSILLMGLVAIIFTRSLDLSIDIKIILCLIAIGVASGLWFLFSDYMSRLSDILHKKFENVKLIRFVYTVVSTLHEYRKMRTQILFAVCISFIAQYLIILCYLMIGLSLNIELPISIYFTIIPIVFVATALPISIGGLGVRESTLITLFLFFQVDKQAAIALSLIYFGSIVLLTLPGGLIILSKNQSKAKPALKGNN